MIIGICGGSGSGKTTLLKRISKELKHLEPS
ncbi:MAG: Phosphoribulokinase / Uridine kinase family, partial [Bacteroidota bacterium]